MTQDQVLQLLQKHDIQPTQQRTLIASVLFERPQHLSAEQVMEQVNRSQANVSKATVYNTLGLFASKGLINEVIVDPSRIFYDSNTSPHYHFYNVDTGILTDVMPDSVEINSLPALPDGTEHDGVDVIFRIRQKQI